MNLPDAVSIIGALGIGSFVGQYLIGSQQRRQVRSEVLRHLAHTESARWVSATTPDPTFTESIRELETAALIARVPRRAVANYKVFAYSAWWLSGESFEQNPDPEFGGGIHAEFADLVRVAAAELSRLVWSPWVGRVGMSRRLREQRQHAGNLERGASAMQRAAEYLGESKG